MKKCRHIAVLSWRTAAGTENGVEFSKCLRCGAWLPLGPANDEPEAVKVEILAAFLVNPGGFVHVAHKDYHDQDWIDEDYNFDLREDCTGCQAENLARAIATHEGRSQ